MIALKLFTGYYGPIPRSAHPYDPMGEKKPVINVALLLCRIDRYHREGVGLSKDDG